MGQELDADCCGGKKGRAVIGALHPWRGRNTPSSDTEATFIARLARTNHLAHRAFFTPRHGKGISFAG